MTAQALEPLNNELVALDRTVRHHLCLAGATASAAIRHHLRLAVSLLSRLCLAVPLPWLLQDSAVALRFHCLRGYKTPSLHCDAQVPTRTGDSCTLSMDCALAVECNDGRCHPRVSVTFRWLFAAFSAAFP